MELDYVKLKEIKPALSGYIRKSQSLLKSSSLPDEKVVHDVRVLMKKSRAVLYLSSPQLEDESYNRDNKALREVGRIMCAWRETSVQRKILKELRKEYPALFASLSDYEGLTSLLIKAEPDSEPSAEITDGLERIEDILSKAGFRIRFQPLHLLDPQLLIKKLEMTYLSVVDKYLVSRNNPKPGNLHEFRKSAKIFLYQLYFFRPLNPSGVKSLERKLDSLTQNIGKFNDLNQLINTLRYKYHDKRYPDPLNELIILIREKQDRHLSRVWPVAYKIFCPGQNLVNILGFKILVI
jgi:CHAD domain-containing protein